QPDLGAVLPDRLDDRALSNARRPGQNRQARGDRGWIMMRSSRTGRIGHDATPPSPRVVPDALSSVPSPDADAPMDNTEPPRDGLPARALRANAERPRSGFPARALRRALLRRRGIPAPARSAGSRQARGRAETRRSPAAP